MKSLLILQNLLTARPIKLAIKLLLNLKKFLTDMLYSDPVLHHMANLRIESFPAVVELKPFLTSSKNLVTSKTLLWITNHDEPAALCFWTSSKVIFFTLSAIFAGPEHLLEREKSMREALPRLRSRKLVTSSRGEITSRD